MTTFDLREIESISREAEVIEGSRMKSRGVVLIGKSCLYDQNNKTLFIFFDDLRFYLRGRKKNREKLLESVRKILQSFSLDQEWRTEKFLVDRFRCVVCGIDAITVAQAIASGIEANMT